MGEARDRWLNDGVEVLAAEGAAGVRIDRIAARLGLSKGSFHHHFDGAEGFKRELLTHIEELLVAGLHDAVAERGVGSGRDLLERLIAVVTAPDGEVYRPELEVALRAWSLTDPVAAESQARIDEARLEVLRGVWRSISDDEDEVRISALLPYVIAVGAMVTRPAVEIDDLRRLYERILPLVPVDGDPQA
ncbi:TetR/AcrR family transcriptional regulator [Nocardioidaceae bacterium SCSIO 66511]|nr:TetR/AcrR family transcriptional regulator [Nocardioidaceae bacterium SCSIO 66511]